MPDPDYKALCADLLSPAAQAQKVLDAANGASSYGPDDCLNESRQIAAAALRAAADQVVPDEPYCFEDDSLCEYLRRTQRQETRAKFFAIATELDGINNTSQED